MLTEESVESLHIGDTKEVELIVVCCDIYDDGISRASSLLMTFIRAERHVMMCCSLRIYCSSTVNMWYL